MNEIQKPYEGSNNLKRMNQLPDFKRRDWIIFPGGHSSYPNDFVLKRYRLGKRGEQLPPAKEVITAMDFLREEYDARKIAPLSGAGFLVVSEGILSVYRWDSKYPNVIVPSVFTSEGDSWISRRVSDVGAFCDGEKLVYDHETKIWLDYLESKRLDADKRAYLSSFLSKE